MERERKENMMMSAGTLMLTEWSASLLSKKMGHFILKSVKRAFALHTNAD